MKKIIYGGAGYGKSYTYLKPILEKEEPVVFIASNVFEELKYMDISPDIFESCNNDLNYIMSGKHCIVIDPCYFLNLIQRITFSDLSKNKNLTVIISTLGQYLASSFTDINDFINIINNWKCNIILEYTGQDLELDNPIWDKWTKIPVLTPCYERRSSNANETF